MTGPTVLSNQALYDSSATMGGGTPLVLLKAAGQDDYHVVVRLQVLQAYEQMIFQLQQELIRYKSIVDQLGSQYRLADEQISIPACLSTASAQLIESITRSKGSASDLRGYEERDD